MPHLSSPASHVAVSENAAGAKSLPRQPIVLSERSLTLLALVRIFVGLLWFQQLAWKMPPTFGGLRRYVESEAQHTRLVCSMPLGLHGWHICCPG